MMRRGVSGGKTLVKLLGLVLELTNIVVANVADTFIGQERFQHFECFVKVFGRQVLDKERNLVFRHARTGRVLLVHVRAHGQGRRNGTSSMELGRKGIGRAKDSKEDDDDKGTHSDAYDTQLYVRIMDLFDAQEQFGRIRNERFVNSFNL